VGQLNYYGLLVCAVNKVFFDTWHGVYLGTFSCFAHCKKSLHCIVLNLTNAFCYVMLPQMCGLICVTTNACCVTTNACWVSTNTFCYVCYCKMLLLSMLPQMSFTCMAFVMCLTTNSYCCIFRTNAYFYVYVTSLPQLQHFQK